MAKVIRPVLTIEFAWDTTLNDLNKIIKQLMEDNQHLIKHQELIFRGGEDNE